MTSETWASYPERPQYEVSDQGRIRGPMGIRKAKDSKDGYQRICLGPRPAITRTVHSMVARTFLGPRPLGQVVAHKNADKRDNRLANLQYISYRGNMLQRRGIGDGVCPLVMGWRKLNPKKLRGEDHGLSKLTTAQVVEIHRLSKIGHPGLAIDRMLGLPRLTAGDIVAGRRWRHIHPDLSLRT